MAQKFDRGGGGGSFRPKFRPGGFGGTRGDRDDRPKIMHQATCSNCGKDCQVPFRPTGDKPVYCRDCFNKQGGERRDFAPAPMRITPPAPVGNESNVELKRQLEQVNAKLERLISAVQAIAQTMAALKPVTPLKRETKKVASKKSK